MPQKNFVYLNNGTNVGGAENTGASAFMIRDVGVGKPNYKMEGSGSTENNLFVGSEAVLVTVNNGSTRYRGTAWAVDQAGGSPVSGYNIDGTPNFGQGQMNVKTTWPADSENSKTPSFNFLVGGQFHNGNYSFTTTT